MRNVGWGNQRVVNELQYDQAFSPSYDLVPNPYPPPSPVIKLDDDTQ